MESNRGCNAMWKDMDSHIHIVAKDIEFKYFLDPYIWLTCKAKLKVLIFLHPYIWLNCKASSKGEQMHKGYDGYYRCRVPSWFLCLILTCLDLCSSGNGLGPPYIYYLSML